MTFYYKNKEQELPEELTEDNIRELVNKHGLDVLKGLCVIDYEIVDEDSPYQEDYHRYYNVERILKDRETYRRRLKNKLTELGLSLNGYETGEDGLFDLSDKAVKLIEVILQKVGSHINDFFIPDIAKTVGGIKKETLNSREQLRRAYKTATRCLNLQDKPDEEYKDRELMVKITNARELDNIQNIEDKDLKKEVVKWI